MTGAERLAAEAARVLDRAPPGPIGVAVSGGGDSSALLLLASRWAEAAGRRIEAATVDHRLRPESATEAAAVAALCSRHGAPHRTLAWQAGPGRGNLQAAARDARRALLATWAAERGLAAVALGHTRDDQAETFLLRLARGSGVDGLAAMAPLIDADGAVWLRPLLLIGREELRAFLAAEGASWTEDPSNADPAFDRVRARAALGPLATLGLGPARLAATAARMARARAALEAATGALARICLVEGRAGDLTLDPGPFAAAPEEIRLRLLAAALTWVAGARYRPRLAALEAAAAAVLDGRVGRGLTLHGCLLRAGRVGLAIRREPKRAAPRVPAAARTWDGRWAFDGLVAPGVEIGALGREGLSQRPAWPEAGLAREALVTTPALWRGRALMEAALLDPGAAEAWRRVAPLPSPLRLGESN